MAQNISDSLEIALLNHTFATPAYTANAALLVGLCTAASDSAYTEVAYTNYARAPITFGAASNRRVTQDADLEFPTCGVTGATADFYAIFNASGDYLAWGQLSSQKIITQNNTPTLISGQVWVEFVSGAITTPYANTLLDMVFNGVAASQPTIFLSLCNADLNDASLIPGTPNPPFNYGDEPVSLWTVTSVTGTNTATNDLEVVFNPPSGPWGAILSVAIIDQANAVLFYDNVPGGEGQEPDVGDSVRFIAGAIAVSFE